MANFDTYLDLLIHEAIERREAHSNSTHWWSLHNPLDCTHCQAHISHLTHRLGSPHNCTCPNCGNTHIDREIT